MRWSIPINHALTPDDAARYKVEPYVVAADVYSVAPHDGRGGWTWYTGSAGWMYRAGIEGILGLTLEGSEIVLDPCFPKVWPAVRASVRLGGTHLAITIQNEGLIGHGIRTAMLDGVPLALDNGRLRLRLPDGRHSLDVTMNV